MEKPHYPDNKTSLRALFTKILTPGLTSELVNLLDDWFESASLTNHSNVLPNSQVNTEVEKIWGIRA